MIDYIQHHERINAVNNSPNLVPQYNAHCNETLAAIEESHGFMPLELPTMFKTQVEK